MPFYKRDSFIWFLLVVLPPVGLFLLWRRKKHCYTPSMLVALSSIFVVWFFILMLSFTIRTENRYLARHQSKTGAVTSEVALR